MVATLAYWRERGCSLRASAAQVIVRTLLSYLEGNAVAGTNRAWPDASVRCPHRRGTGTRLRRYRYSPGTSDVPDNDGCGRLVAPDPNAAYSPNDTTSRGHRRDCRSRRSQMHALSDQRKALTSTNAIRRCKMLGRPPLTVLGSPISRYPYLPRSEQTSEVNANAMSRDIGASRTHAGVRFGLEQSSGSCKALPQSPLVTYVVIARWQHLTLG